VPNPQRGWFNHPFRIPRELRLWLSDKGSLTRRLRSRCSSFRVRKLMRLDKPIGILLLLWPTLWGQWLASRGDPTG
jgi:hypothetical protein